MNVKRRSSTTVVDTGGFLVRNLVVGDIEGVVIVVGTELGFFSATLVNRGEMEILLVEARWSQKCGRGDRRVCRVLAGGVGIQCSRSRKVIQLCLGEDSRDGLGVGAI